MLIAPSLRKGAQALKTFFLRLFNSPLPPRHVNRCLVGALGAYLLGIAALEYWHSITVQPSGLASSPVANVQVASTLEPSPVDVQLASTVESLPVTPVLEAVPEVSPLDAAPDIILEVPTLDWSVPEKPTVFAPKTPEVPSDVVSYDFYFNIVEFAPSESTFWKEKQPMPVIPNDDAPPVWEYEYPELMFDRLCLRKGMPPASFSQRQIDVLFALRGGVLIFVLWNVVLWFVDYPRNILAAWRMFRERRWSRGVAPVLPDHLLDDHIQWNWH